MDWWCDECENVAVTVVVVKGTRFCEEHFAPVRRARPHVELSDSRDAGSEADLEWCKKETTRWMESSRRKQLIAVYKGEAEDFDEPSPAPPPAAEGMERVKEMMDELPPPPEEVEQQDEEDVLPPPPVEDVEAAEDAEEGGNSDEEPPPPPMDDEQEDVETENENAGAGGECPPEKKETASDRPVWKPLSEAEEKKLGQLSSILVPWLNNVLSVRDLRVENIETDFEDGVLLLTAMEILTEIPLDYTQDPSTADALADNFAELETVFGANDIDAAWKPRDFQGNVRAIVMLLGQIARKFRGWKKP